MTTIVDNIVPSVPLTVAAAEYYTSSGIKTIIDKFTVTNTSATVTALVDVHIIAGAGAASDANVLIKNQPVFPKETHTFPPVVGHTMKSGDRLLALSSVTGAVLRVSGRKVSS